MLKSINYSKDEHNRVGIGLFFIAKLEFIIDLFKNINEQTLN